MFDGWILMADPSLSKYSIDYSINTWMDKSKNVEKTRAQDQWNYLRDLIAHLGVRVNVISVPRPDGVFSANAGFVYGNTFITSSFRHKERQDEEPYWYRWAASLIDCNNPNAKRFKVIHRINEAPFEGAGDALMVGETICCGWGYRTTQPATKQLSGILGTEVVPLRLINDRFYHLDTCFCSLNDKLVMYYPKAFTIESREIIEERFDTIVVSEKDAYQFACNSVVINDKVIIPKHCTNTCSLLRMKGFESFEVDMSEFIKSGGAAKCLTLRYQ